MGVSFEILYHELVITDDISRLSSVWREKIRRTIENRLTKKPEVYGKPLRKSLKGYRRLRVGDYRVVYKIRGKTVKILAIQHRSVAYNKMNNRDI